MTQFIIPELEEASKHGMSLECYRHKCYLEREYKENKEVVEKNKQNLIEALKKYISENSLDDELFRGEMFEKLVHWLPKNPAGISSLENDRLSENITIRDIQYLYNEEGDRRGVLLKLDYPGFLTFPPESYTMNKYTYIYTTIWWIKEKHDFEGQWTTNACGDGLTFYEGNKLWKDGGYFKDKEIFKPNIEPSENLIAHYCVRHALMSDGIHRDRHIREIYKYEAIIECDNDYYENVFSKILKKFIKNEKQYVMEIPLISDDYFPKDISFKKILFYKLPLAGVFEPDSYEDDVELGATIERVGFEITPQNELEIYCNVASLEYLHFASFKEKKFFPFIWGRHVGSFKNEFIERAQFYFYYK